MRDNVDFLQQDCNSEIHFASEFRAVARVKLSSIVKFASQVKLPFGSGGRVFNLFKNLSFTENRVFNFTVSTANNFTIHCKQSLQFHF